MKKVAGTFELYAPLCSTLVAAGQYNFFLSFILVSDDVNPIKVKKSTDLEYVRYYGQPSEEKVQESGHYAAPWRGPQLTECQRRTEPLGHPRSLTKPRHDHQAQRRIRNYTDFDKTT